MSNPKLILRALAVLPLFLTLGCGGGGGGGFNPGVAGNKPLNTLSDAEVATLCKNADAYFSSSPDIKEANCRTAGVFAVAFTASVGATDKQLQDACQTVYNQCIKAPASSSGGDGGTSNGTCNKPPASCTATVDQMTACLNELTATLKNSVPACNTLTVASLGASANPPDGGSDTTGPACKAYEAACPDMVGVGGATGALRAAKR
jgi:hypothetical protein